MNQSVNRGLLVLAACLWLALTVLAFTGAAWRWENILPLSLSLAILIAGQAGGARAAQVFVAASLLVCAAWVAGHVVATPVLAGSVATYFAFGFYPKLLEIRRGDSQVAYDRAAVPLRQGRDTLKKNLESLRQRASEMRRRGAESDGLFHLAKEIGRVLTLDDMLELARERVAETLQRRHSSTRPGTGSGTASRFLLLLEDKASRKLKTAFSSDETDELKRLLTEGPGMAWIRGLSRPVLAADGRSAQALALAGVPAGLHLPGAGSFVVAPLLIRGQSIGSLMVYDRQTGAFGPRDLENFGLLASQLAIGIEKALLYEEVERLSITDGLTGLYVHRFFQERLEEELRRAARYATRLSLLMLDIDHFKDVNDTLGHGAGDEVLKKVAGLLASKGESLDLVARYGGEEFSLVLPDQDLPAALKKAERIRAAVEGEPFQFNGQALRITLSAGVACYPDHAMTPKLLIERADQALYASKTAGRNRVTAAS
jgi:diguanylate cyclase (GGDEF)-like protein